MHPLIRACCSGLMLHLQCSPDNPPDSQADPLAQNLILAGHHPCQPHVALFENPANDNSSTSLPVTVAPLHSERALGAVN